MPELNQGYSLYMRGDVRAQVRSKAGMLRRGLGRLAATGKEVAIVAGNVELAFLAPFLGWRFSERVGFRDRERERRMGLS